MRNRLSAARRLLRMERRVAARASRESAVERMRAWIEECREAGHKRNHEAKKARVASGVSRGVDRVPAHLQGLAVTTEALVEHEHPNYRSRRAHMKQTGRWVRGKNTPYIKPLQEEQA